MAVISGLRRLRIVIYYCFCIEDKRNHKLNYRLNVSVHNASDPTCPKIVDIASFTGDVEPFEKTITAPIDMIVFDPAKSLFA